MEPFNKKKYAIGLTILGVAAILVYVFYSHKYNRAYSILPILFFFVAWMFVLAIWIDWPWLNKQGFFVRRIIHGSLFAIVVTIVFTPISNWRSNYEQGQLKRYGVLVKGRVTYDRSEIEYYYNGETYNQRLRDSVNLYRYHDELKVLCSSHDPEIFKIVGHRSALDIKY